MREAILLFPINNVECANAQPGSTEGHLSLAVSEVNIVLTKGLPSPPPLVSDGRQEQRRKLFLDKLEF